jgi:hypothetical protein
MSGCGVGVDGLERIAQHMQCSTLVLDQPLLQTRLVFQTLDALTLRHLTEHSVPDDVGRRELDLALCCGSITLLPVPCVRADAGLPASPSAEAGSHQCDILHSRQASHVQPSLYS